MGHYLIYIKDLDSRISSDISEFADDSKIGKIIRSQSDIKDLQDDLDRLKSDWVVKWQIQFNIDKCRVMNVGWENPHNRYNISNVTLNRSEFERDLGVQVCSDLRPRKQSIAAKNQANKVLGFIARSVKSRSAEVILKLYSSLVKPHLDYASQFWSPYCKLDIGWIDSVQKKMTNMIQGIRNLSYERRLKLLQLYSLERRRLGGDLIEVFKWIKVLIREM